MLVVLIPKQTNLCLTILVAVITNEPVAAVNKEVDVASLDVGVKEVASRAGVVGVMLSSAVPIPLTILLDYLIVCNIIHGIQIVVKGAFVALGVDSTNLSKIAQNKKK